MSDIAPDETPEVEAPQVETPETAEAPEVDPFDDEATQTFPREYVAELRKRQATYRERAKTYESAFDGLDEDSQAWYLNELIPAFKSDPKATIAALAEHFGITKAEAADALEEAAEEPAPDAPLTRAEALELARQEAQRLYEERQAAEKAEAEQKALEQSITDEAKQLGYNPNAEAGTPEHADYRYLLILARDAYDGDLAKAHEVIEAGRQKIIAEHVAKLEAQNSQSPNPVRGGSMATPAEGPPKTLAEARRAASAALAAQGFPKK